jgi:uncharacterized membrane protein
MIRLRFLGHPIHPMLVHFPMAFLFLPLPLQAAAVLVGRPELFKYAGFSEALGLIAAVPAAITGLLDYAAMQGGEEKVMDKAGLHMLIMVGAVCLFAGDFIVGWFARGAESLILLRLMLTGSGMAALAVGGYLGADLVWRHGVGHKADHAA